MVRPKTRVGHAGLINVHTYEGGFRARTRFRESEESLVELSATGKSRTAAKAALHKKIEERAAVVRDTVTTRTDVRATAERWLQHKRRDADLGRSGCRPQSVDKDEMVLRNDIVPHLGHLTLRELNVPVCERFIDKIVDTGKLSKAAKARTTLIVMLDWAVRQGAIPTNPARLTSPVPSRQHRPTALTPEFIARLRAAVRVPDKNRPHDLPGVATTGLADYLPVCIDLMLGTGIRYGEALALRWSDVNLDDAPAPYIEITGTLVYVRTIGLYRQDTPKSESGNRVILLPQFAADALRAIHPRQAPAHRPVFATRNGTYTNPNNMRRRLRHCLENAGIEDKFSPHMLRSTVATTLARADTAGVDVAASVLGHASTTTTLKHYVERARQAPDVRAVVETLVTDQDRTLVRTRATTNGTRER